MQTLSHPLHQHQRRRRGTATRKKKRDRTLPKFATPSRSSHRGGREKGRKKKRIEATAAVVNCVGKREKKGKTRRRTDSWYASPWADGSTRKEGREKGEGPLRTGSAIVKGKKGRRTNIAASGPRKRIETGRRLTDPVRSAFSRRSDFHPRNLTTPHYHKKREKKKRGEKEGSRLRMLGGSRRKKGKKTRGRAVIRRRRAGILSSCVQKPSRARGRKGGEGKKSNPLAFCWTQRWKSSSPLVSDFPYSTEKGGGEGGRASTHLA